MKLLVVSDYRNTQSVRPEAEWMIGLKKEDIDVRIITYPGSEYAIQFSDYNIPVETTHPTQKWDPTFIKYLRQRIQKERIDFVLLFNSSAITNGIKAARNTSVKVLLYRGYAGHISWYDPAAYLKFLHPRVDKIICVSQAVVADLSSRTFIRQDKLITIHKGHHSDWYDHVAPSNLSHFSIPDDAFVLACMANVRKFKGIPYLLKALPEISDLENLHVLMIGHGMESSALSKLRENSRMKERVHLTGFRDDVLSLLSACDLFILPSTHGEGLSKSLLEAMLLALPVIATDIPANREVLGDQISADILVPPKNSQALAIAVRNMYSNPERRKSWGKQLRLYAMGAFHIDRTISETVSLLKRLS
ncbi:MAG: glycosyltransferase family 4 protein [Saprospiraceae bacterium]|nr:glycosyltransferase family 4 protein [Saprospiraceae bacterium]